jgi:hypothetical protein
MNQQILIAIIAASAALFGVIISQAISILLSSLDKKHKKNILLRQKYEEMMFHFQDSLTYYNQVGACKTLDQLLQQTHCISANRAIGLALLYFQNLVPLFDIYIRNYLAYYNLIVSVYDQNIPATAGAQARVHAKKELENIEAKLFQSKNAMLDAINENVKKYIKA